MYIDIICYAISFLLSCLVRKAARALVRSEFNGATCHGKDEDGRTAHTHKITCLPEVHR